MEKLQFRGKPKIVDLTSQRKLADKVQSLLLHGDRPAETMHDMHVIGYVTNLCQGISTALAYTGGQHGMGARDRPKSPWLQTQVEEATLHCGDEERDELLYYILAAHPGRTLVFANAVSTARRIAALLHILKLPSAALHAGETLCVRAQQTMLFLSRCCCPGPLVSRCSKG